MTDTFTATEDEIKICRTGIYIQAEARGLDINDKKVKSFLDNQVMVDAQYLARIRFLENILNGGLNES